MFGRLLGKLALSIFAVATALAADQPLPRVIVFGNRSLKPDTVVRMSGLYQDAALEQSEIKKRLVTTNMFSSVEVFRDEDIVTIYVHEKQAWFVVPYFSKDVSAMTYGVAFGKSTIFGQDASVVGRYQRGTGNHVASLLLRDETLLETPWIVGASADYEDALHWVYRGRDLVHRLQNENAGGSLQLGYRVTPHLSFALNQYAERHRYEELDGTYHSGVQWSSRLSTELSKFYVDEGLAEGWAAKIYLENTIPVSDFKFWKTGVSSQVSLFREGDLNWITYARAELSPTLPRYQLFELGGARLRGFPSQVFRDRWYLASQNDVLITSLNVWMLRVRPLVFGDWAFIEGQGHPSTGGGFQVFVKDIAIPAIQIFFGYGFNPNGFAASAAIGPQL